MAEDDEEKTEFHTDEGVYCFTHMPKELKNPAARLQRMMEKVLADQRGRNVEIYLEEIIIKSKNKQDQVQDVEETLRKLKRVNNKIDPITSLFKVNEGRFLGHMVTREGVRADPEKVKTIILSPTLKNPNQIRSLFLQLTAISKFIPKLAELKYPIRKICYTPTEKMVQALIHTTRSLRAIFRKHKVKVVIDGPIEEILKLFGREGRLAKWAAEVWTYDISYIKKKEAEGSVVKKFFGQGEHVQKTPNANEEGTINLSKKLQAKSTPTRAWRLYLGKETIEEGSGVGIILVSPQ
ncbi:hypothetical protein Tco_1152347 [Tanacetum coccineum]